jgi:O-antigen ligase
MPGQAIEAAQERRIPRGIFWIVVAFMILEYVRPPLLPKLKLQMVIIVLIPLIWLQQRGKPWSRILTAHALFLAWCAKAIPISSNWYAAYFVTRMMWGNIAIALALTWLGTSFRYFRRIIWIWVGIMAYEAIFALAHGGKGTGGFLGDENDLALGCVTALPLAFFGFDGLKGWRRWLLLAVVILLVAAVVATFSRGGFLALTVVLIFCVLASQHRFRNLTMLVALATIAFFTVPPSFLTEIRSITDYQTGRGTGAGRLFMWSAAFNMWKANPVLGVGGGNTAFLLGRYQPRDWEGAEYNEMDWSGFAVHSLYFQLLPEQGIPGVCMFIGLLVLHFRSASRLRLVTERAPPAVRQEILIYRAGLNGGLLGYLAAGVFVSVLYYPYLWYFTALMGALVLGTEDYLRRLQLISRSTDRRK